MRNTRITLYTAQSFWVDSTGKSRAGRIINKCSMFEVFRVSTKTLCRPVIAPHSKCLTHLTIKSDCGPLERKIRWIFKNEHPLVNSAAWARRKSAEAMKLIEHPGVKMMQWKPHASRFNVLNSTTGRIYLISLQESSAVSRSDSFGNESSQEAHPTSCTCCTRMGETQKAGFLRRGQ